LWIWHIPWLFEQTLRNDGMHAAQHATFLATALILWRALVNRTPALGYGGGVVYVFATILHASVLGALLTFAPRAWYSSYMMTSPAWHLSGLEDQQIGGLIMWIPAGTLLLVAALVLLVRWMHESQPARGLSGSYAVHGHDVDMKLANGSPYQKYRFAVEQDGKVLTLTAKEPTISASREH
jgi:putative membrane protein